ncbi:MAG: hypothetical protein HY332_19010 [Chloroflexi bacterium]|nr:hypothetical protein [Chloroflexota bacterium]
MNAVTTQYGNGSLFSIRRPKDPAVQARAAASDVAADKKAVRNAVEHDRRPLVTDVAPPPKNRAALGKPRNIT